MKVLFDHIAGFGKVKHLDFIFSNPYGLLEEGESAARALKNGWIPWGECWYNLRSVRIDLSMYKPSDTAKRLSNKIVAQIGDLRAKQELYISIYHKYCDHHGFERNIDWTLFEGCQVIEYHHDGILVGISLYRVYEDQFVAMQFIWDYADPKLSLGNVAQLFECKFAKEIHKCTHVYLLGGYEQCCAYKANFKGFEFWTGRHWTSDKQLYASLIDKDERIQVLIPEEHANDF